MPIICSLIWAAMTAGVMAITMKYYLPRLAARAQIPVSEASAARQETDEAIPSGESGCKTALLRRPVTRVLVLAACAGLSGWCGWTASLHSLSMIALFKMMLTMAVLSCVFITDLELMLIPNLCSLILVAGRLAVFLVEWLLLGRQALGMLLSSTVILVGSTVFLLFLSRLTKGGLGMGDVKLYSSMGFLCGIYAVCYTLVCSFLLCAIVSTVLLLFKKKTLKDALPMGPFIWLGYTVPVLLSIM